MSGTEDGVLIAVATFRRNAELASLLPLLQEHAQTLDRPTEVLVVDNDPDAGARPTVAGAGVTYRHEPRPGIAAARNAALDHAAYGHRYVVFIDDDEYPRPGWLALLMAALVDSGVAAVAGAVESEFEGEPNLWVLASGLFDRRRVPSGTAVDAAATNNLAIDLTRTSGLRFDDRLGLIGGSDHLFTRTLTGRGERLLWCAEAIVVDHVPKERATPGWVMRRAYRIGNSEVMVSLMLASDSAGRRYKVRTKALVGGVGRVIVGGLRRVTGRLTGRLTTEAGGARLLHRGRGHITGALGVRYAEYSRGERPQRFRTRKK